LIADKKVKAILVNIFGGIMKVIRIAQVNYQCRENVSSRSGSRQAVKEQMFDKGKQLLKKTRRTNPRADNLADAAQKSLAQKPVALTGYQNPNSQGRFKTQITNRNVPKSPETRS